MDNDGAKSAVRADGVNYIDAVAISHEFTDHCHKQTLMEVPKTVPVFAWSKASAVVKGFKWFEKVAEIPAFTKDWRDTSIGESPPSSGLAFAAGRLTSSCLIPSLNAANALFSADGKTHSLNGSA